MTRLAIVDVGCGNTGSVAMAFRRLGAVPVITGDADEIVAASHVVLPGVGAAGFAMARIEAFGLASRLSRLTQPVLGICLGMQLLFERSEEEGIACLGLVPGHVRKLAPAPRRPVPHMGWSKLSVRASEPGLGDGDYVYFAHSFACDDGPYSIATTDYGAPITAAVRRDNYLGVQFHPERSGKAGARLLEAFLEQ